MYAIDHLLKLVATEHAEQLRLYVGVPPIIVLRGEHHMIEGPPLSLNDADQLFRSIADTRQRRQLKERGRMNFVYTFERSLHFMVHARIENDNVRLHVYPYGRAA